MSNLFEEKAREIVDQINFIVRGFGYPSRARDAEDVISAALVSAYEMGCQAGSIAKGDGSSEPAVPLQSSVDAEAVVTAVIDDISAQMHQCFATGQDERAEVWRLRLEGAARVAQKLGMLHPIEEAAGR